MLIVAEENSHNCLEGDNYSATDRYFSIQSIYTQCLEGENLPKIKYICNTCGCEGECYPSQIQKYCSYACYWVDLVNKKTGVEFTEERKRKISESKKGEKHHFYGKHFNEDHRRKISDGNKGKHQSDESKRKMSEGRKGKIAFKGSNHPLYGKHPSEETKRKISVSLKGRIPWHKGKTGVYSEETRKRISEAQKGKPAPKTAFKKGHPMPVCENSPLWRGGLSFEPYCPKFNDRLKEKIRERDNRICQLCSTKENGKKLCVHHVHYDKENCAPDLISLCERCSTKVNFNRDYYETLFTGKLKARGLLC